MMRVWIAVLVLLTFHSFGIAREFVVSPDGSGNWSELNQIDFSQFEPGDVLSIKAGTYRTSLTVKNTSGIRIQRKNTEGAVTITAPVYIQAPNITIDGGNRDAFRIDVPAPFNGYILSTDDNPAADNFTLQNVTVVGHYGPVDGWGTTVSLFGKGATFRNCRIIGAPHQDQLKINTSGFFNFEYCEFLDAEQLENIHADVIQARALNWSVRFYRCYFKPKDSGVQTTMLSTGTTNPPGPVGNIEFTENVFVGPSIKSIHLKAAEVSSVGTFRVIRNTFYKSNEITGGFPYEAVDNIWLEDGPIPPSPVPSNTVPPPTPTPTPTPEPTPVPTTEPSLVSSNPGNGADVVNWNGAIRFVFQNTTVEGLYANGWNVRYENQSLQPLSDFTGSYSLSNGQLVLQLQLKDVPLGDYSFTFTPANSTHVSQSVTTTVSSVQQTALPTPTPTPSPTPAPDGSGFTSVGEVDFTAVASPESVGWTGHTRDGYGGSTSFGPAGLCMTVPAAGLNYAGWKSPTNFFDLSQRTVYRVRVHLSTDQTTPGAIPLVEVAWSNIQGELDVNPGFLNFGGSRWFLDIEGGANSIGRSNGRDYYDVYISPLAIDTPQWNGEIAGEDFDDSAFSPAAAVNTGVRLQIQLPDDNLSIGAEQDSGSVYVERIVVESIPLESLAAEAQTVFDSPIHTDRYDISTWGEDGLAGHIGSSIADGTITFRMPALLDDEGNIVESYARAMVVMDDITQGGAGMRDPNTGAWVVNPMRRFQTEWKPETLYRGRTAISAPEGEADPVDIIAHSWASYTFEIGGIDWVTSGNLDVPGGMPRAGSPRDLSTTGGVAPEWMSFFHGHNVTDSLIANSNRIALRPDFYNRHDIGLTSDAWSKAAGGTDLFTLHSIEIDEVLVGL